MELQKAKKENTKLKIGLSGASGVGKTYSALLLAYGISNDWSKIAIIDTENGSSNLYAHLGNFNVLQLEAPFSPDKYIEAISTCENANMEVIIIDSISNEWKGSGGCLDIHRKLGGRFQDWGAVTPKHQAFVDKIIQSDVHLITTVRRRIEYVAGVDDRGKMTVTKLGTKEEMRNGFEYDLTLNFELINDKHLARVTKDRTGLFLGKEEFIINTSTGKKLAEWSKEYIDLTEIFNEINSCTTIEGLQHVYTKYPSIKNRIKEVIIQRKTEIESAKDQIINTNQIQNT
tara:strand:- start:821 stop:1681 length:861 start_codon:yes stop_codon:yes gene_type:complete